MWIACKGRVVKHVTDSVVHHTLRKATTSFKPNPLHPQMAKEVKPPYQPPSLPLPHSHFHSVQPPSTSPSSQVHQV